MCVCVWHISYRAGTLSPLPTSCRTNVNGFVFAVLRSGLYCAVDKELVSQACGEKAALFKVPSFAGAGQRVASVRASSAAKQTPDFKHCFTVTPFLQLPP